MADQLRGKFPKLGALMDEAEIDVLAFIDLPQGALAVELLHEPAAAPERRDQAASGHRVNLLERYDYPSKRLWVIVKRFFATTAGVLADTNPALAEQLRRATPHWMRHTHATHALQRGAELTTVRDNRERPAIPS